MWNPLSVIARAIGAARMDAGSAPTTAHRAASVSRRLGGWRPGSSGPNAIVSAEAPELIRRSRDLVRNSEHAKRAIGLFGTHIIGTGIAPRSLCTNKKVRDALHQLWSDWVDSADAAGAFDIYGLQTHAARETATAGEEFIRLRTRRLSDGLPVPLQLQLLPAEQLPLDYSIPFRGNEVTQGIERDAIGRRVAYWMYPRHPGDLMSMIATDGNQPSRIDAADICHMRWCPPNQLRGLPWLSAPITTLHQLGEWRDASLLRKQLLASLVGFVKRAASEPLDVAKLRETFGEIVEQLGDLPAVNLEPGTMQYLEPGEEVSFTQWQETAGQDEVFERSGLRALSSGLDLIYEEVSGDWANTNDRTFRAAFNTLKRTIGQYQYQMVAFQFCRPVWLRWIDLAVASGALKVPKSVSDADLRRVQWQPQDWEYLNPTQDVQAKLDAIAGGLDSRTAVIARRGDDVETIDAQRAADQQRERELNIAPPPAKPAAAPTTIDKADQPTTNPENAP